MPFNGSEIIDNPLTTIMSTYTDILGMVAYVIILTFVIGAVYLKTQSGLATAASILITSMLFATAGVFADVPQLMSLAIVVAALAFIGVIISFVLKIRR
jgi:hypothetical protein